MGDPKTEAIEKKLNEETIAEDVVKAAAVQAHGALPTGIIERKISLDEKVEAKPAVEVVGVAANKDGKQVISEASSSNSGDQLTMVPSEMHNFYKHEGFGKAETRQIALEGAGYNINKRPLAIDQSPLKELAPQFEEIQPITSYKKALGHEHSYVYTFFLPDGVKDTQASLRNDCPYGTATAWSIPALTILKENLLGMPLQGLEWPVIASANPTSSNSYLHAVIHRVDRCGALDLRFQITASKKYNVKETYILGRIWTPLTNINIVWESAAENYDAAQPTIYPAFADIGKITLDTRKELTNLTQMLRFIDRTFPPDIEQSMVGVLEGLGRNKLSLSRLYWRIWCSIAEATLCESQDKRWRVKRIYNTHAPMTLNGPVVLRELFIESQMAVQPFFLTHSMLDSIGGGHLIELFQFLLCENFDSKCNFGITRNWPSLGNVRVVLPAGHSALHSVPADMMVSSEDLYAVLNYFARTLNQQHLIDEIGKTVSMFLVRPEGEHAWLGHSFVSMKLPPFRCKRTLHLAWANAENDLDYPEKTPPYYKLAWLGAIRYLQIGLSANTVLSELGLFSGLQLENSGIKMPREWCAAMYRLFSRRRGTCEFNIKIQHVGLRCDWGCLMNRITSSILIIRPLLTNFTRLPQWQEWLLFQRLQPESTWMAGQMGHIIPRTLLEPQKSYNPTLCGVESGLGDIYYRLITDESADVMLHAVSLAQASMIMRKATTLCSSTGLPLDGQFRHLQVGNDINTYYHFVPRSQIACGKIMQDWHRRKEYHWQLISEFEFECDGVGIRGGEVHLESHAMAPSREIGTGHFSRPRAKPPHYILTDSYEALNEGVLVYGNPDDGTESEHDDEFSLASGVSENPYPNGVRADMVYEQEYPIHYCQSGKKPTVGTLMLKYGISVETSTGGVTVFSNQEMHAMAARMENLHELMTYKAPHPISRRLPAGTIPEAGIIPKEPERETDAIPLFQTDATKKLDLLAEKIRKKSQKRARERKALQEKKEQQEQEKIATMTTSMRNNVQAQISKWKMELRAFAKAWDADLTLLEVDPAWLSWDSMEDLNAASTGSADALTCRYSNILRNYDNKDLVAMIRLVPRICRGELCRVITHMMEECVCYLTSSSRDVRIHQRLKAFFTLATDNFQHCNILTEEELHNQFGCNHLKFNDWQCYGTLPFESFIEIPIKWTEQAESCKFKEEHTHAAGPGPEGAGQYSGTGGPYRPNKDILEPIREEHELEKKIVNIVEDTISKSPCSEEQGFRSAREHCSAQSPVISASSHAAHFSDTTAHHNQALSLSASSKQVVVGETPKQVVKPKIQKPAETESAPKVNQEIKMVQMTKPKARTPVLAPAKTKETSKIFQRYGSTVASRTRAKTKMAAALKDVFSTGSSIKSFHSLDDMHTGGAIGASSSATMATFEKLESDMSAQSAPASTHGSPHFTHQTQQ